ncbi:hypothetical protein HMPREF0262_00794 [Clostridium sp. ATCC 29733]|nr:hypothetical protein HMPREF0262_00794 [Clostridium sp. ATCC 29733]
MSQTIIFVIISHQFGQLQPAERLILTFFAALAAKWHLQGAAVTP